MNILNREHNQARAMSRGIWLLLVLICLVGAFFRLYELGVPSMRGDTIEFYKICARNVGPGQIFSKWIELLGISGALPFPVAITRWLMDICRLDLSFFSVRLASALWGILAIPCAFGFGRAFRGNRTGLLLALLLSVNPVQIQMSREAYFYPPLITGAFLMFWALVMILRLMDQAAPLKWPFYPVAGIGFLLMTYSLPTTWFFAFLAALFMVGVLTWKVVHREIGWWKLAVLLGIFLVIGLPLLLSKWGLHHLLQYSRNQGMGVADMPIGSTAWKFITLNGWGTTPLRLMVTFLLVGAGLAAIWIHKNKESRRDWFMLVIMGVGFVLVVLSCLKAGQPFAMRYLIHLIPAYLLIITLGLELLVFDAPSKMRLRPVPLGMARAIALAIPVFLYIGPAWASVKLTGKPTPYKEIVGWLDHNLPKGAPVLVDRWLEPWNEFAVHAPTNVFVTFTVPDEPLEQFLRVNWRQTAKDFFIKYPDAAYIELVHHYWDEPGVGPWTWPREFFRQKTVITNEPGLELRKLGLAAREGFYTAHTNQLVVPVFYNTRQDVLDMAREQGKSAIVLYGSNWGYTKLWRQIQGDFRDWRVLSNFGDLVIANLTDRPMDMVVHIVAVAPQGAKNINVNGQKGTTFQANQMRDWPLMFKGIPPGEHTVRLSDELWGLAQVPLLVQQVRLEASPPEPTGGHAN